MVSSNGKFRCFPDRILIQKDNTYNKVLKGGFYTKETAKKGIEKVKCCKFCVICGNLSERVSGKQSSLNLSIFSFQFCRNVQFSFNFEFSVKLSFQQNSRAKFSFSCLTFVYFYFLESFLPV